MGKNLSREEILSAANTIRGLSMDAVQKAKSGHPGMPMGMADVAAVLFLKHIKHCPSNPKWFDRDRFVLSGGHGSPLLYAVLHLSGYDLSLADVQGFRQIDSKTPGHPEYGHTPGVETTTGPLGQGCGNAVGMALAERMLAEQFNTADQPVVDHYTYVFCGDGDMMEGISHEAFSLAGHLGLNKLIAFYDSNRITIEGSTELAYSDDVRKRFLAYHWNVLEIDAHNSDEADRAIRRAKRERARPTIIICRSHIGYGSPNKQDSASAHGEPLGEEEVKATKRNLGMPDDQLFHVPPSVLAMFADVHASMKRKMNRWDKLFAAWAQANPERAGAWKAHMENTIPEQIEQMLPAFDVSKPVATRVASGKVIQELAKVLPQLAGGAADLSPSTKTRMEQAASVRKGAFCGRNLHFGVREHAMGAMLNGMALHGGFCVYGSTFFVFVDYFRPSMRLAAIMQLPVVYVLTHDSFCVGEDGPTHEPVEHMASLRCMPNMTVIRPADATETGTAWLAALRNRGGPTCLLLSRQNLPVIDRSKYPPASSITKGAYVLWQSGSGMPDLILMASGSEVSLVLKAAELLGKDLNVRVVNMASFELFEKQTPQYREEVLPRSCGRRLGVEAGTSFGWARYVGDRGKMIALDHFGLSGPYDVLMTRFGFTVEHIVSEAKSLLV